MVTRFALFPVFLGLFASLSFSQVTGRLTGSVTDASGAAGSSASVHHLLFGSARPILSTVSTPEGLFSFTGVRPTTYDVVVESKGFLKYSLRGVKIDPGRETSLPAIQMELAAVTQSVDVTADVQTVQTSNAE